MDTRDVNPIKEMDASETTLHVVVSLPPGYMYIPDRHHFLNVGSSDESVVSIPPFDLPDLSFDWQVPITVRSEGRVILHLEGQVFFCPTSDATICIYATIDEEWTVRVRAGSDRGLELVHEVKVMEALDGARMLRSIGSIEVKDA